MAVFVVCVSCRFLLAAADVVVVNIVADVVVVNIVADVVVVNIAADVVVVNIVADVVLLFSQMCNFAGLLILLMG